MFDSVVADLAPFAREFLRRGKQIHLVGGAVRSLLLGQPAKDYDFTTDALPDEVVSYFKKVIPTGIQHGTVTVMFQGRPFEVTTFRVDSGYADGRRPDKVAFTPSLEEDLKRRDFTVNAVALNLADGSLVDPHGGRGDITNRLLRTVGDPGERFDEDALRLLRLFRFASQLGFSIDGATLEAVPLRRARLALVSRERVREELAKAMAGQRPDLAWGPLAELGFLSDLFAPLTPRTLKADSLRRLASLPADLRWPWWLTIACGPPVAWESVLKSLTFSNADIAAFTGPAAALGHLGEGAKAVIAAWGSRHRADVGVAYLSALEDEGWWTDASRLKQEIARAAASSEAIFLKELAIDGTQLLKAGVPPGPQVGTMLEALQRAVWNNPGLNTRPSLLEETERLLASAR